LRSGGFAAHLDPIGVEDDEETRNDQGPCRAGCEGHPTRDTQAAFVGGEDPATTHIDSWKLRTPVGSKVFGPEALRLYPEQRLLATLVLDKEAAIALASSGGSISLNSYTASGVFVSGTINAPNGDQAIAVSFKDCT
jgi:hypothetical protein